MDKPRERKTITIKINGKESPFEEKNKKEDAEQQEVEANEQQSKTVKQNEQETAAAKDQSDENDRFEWILPKNTNPPMIEEFKTTSSSTKKNKKPTTKKTSFKTMKLPLKKINPSIFLSIFFAVLLGTFFGLMLLKIVPAEKVVDDNQPVINNNIENSPSGGKQESSGALEGTRQAISVAVVQEGIYSTKDNAEKIKEELKNKGIPAEIFATDQQFALFVGLAGTIEEAKVVGSQLKSDGTDTFAKQWSVGEKQISHLTEEEKKTLDLSPQVYQSLLDVISSANGTNKIPQKEMENANKQMASLAKIKKEKLENKQILGIQSQLEAAAVQVKGYNQDPKPKTLQTVQQHLLTFLAHYQSL